MNNAQKVGLVLAGVGVVFVLAKFTGLAQGTQLWQGTVFMLAGVGIYFTAGRT
jgi:hypothetical protein